MWKKCILIFLMILSIGCLFLKTPLIEMVNDPDNENLNFKRESTPHEPIVINGNSEFAAKALAENWPGNGSKENPYIIEEWVFDGSSSIGLIRIMFTDVFFEIRYCILINGYISFYEVSNGQISQNELINTTLIASYSEYFTLTKNLVKSNNGDGIVFERSNNIKFDENNIETNLGEGLHVVLSENIIFYKNSIRDNGKNGIHLEGSLNASSIDNNIIGNNGTGIMMGESESTMDTSTGAIIGNTIVNNSKGGLIFCWSANNIISNNKIVNNGPIGIDLGFSVNNTIVHNILEKNYFHMGHDNAIGLIAMQVEVWNNSINGKELIYWQNVSELSVPNGVGQIILMDCQSISVINQRVFGIFGSGCSNISIVNNEISGTGIQLGNSHNNHISNNIVQNTCKAGIHLRCSDNNTLINNTITYSQEEGILFSGAGGRTSSINSYLADNAVSHNGKTGIKLGHVALYPLVALDYNNPTKNCTLINNVISHNNGTGINVVSHSSYFAKNHILYNKEVGIHLFSASSCQFIGNTIVNNYDYGIYIGYYYRDNYHYKEEGGGGPFNLILYNNLVSNAIGKDSQASDNSLNNTFSNNYWDEWITPDVNNDSVVDVPYPIDGLTNNYDEYPASQPYSLDPRIAKHILYPPRIRFPNGGEILTTPVIISWLPAFDNHLHPISYSLYYSSDAGKIWNLIATNVSTPNYQWNVTQLPISSLYMVKVEAVCSEGLTVMDISDNTFSIIKIVPTTPTSSKHSSRGTPYVLVIIIIPFIILKRKINKKLNKRF